MAFVASALLMCIIIIIIYPHYKYYIDPDATAYLTIAARYAKGDYTRAINGLWSPMGCWLTALTVKTGIGIIDASWIVNIIAAICFLFITHSFFLRFGVVQKLQWGLNITLSLFLCSAVFWQSFDDIWSCFFALASLRIIVVKNFKSRPLLWVFCGLMGALAYFSKAYFFPFFLLNTVCCTYFIARESKLQWIKICVACIATMLLFSFPWIFALHYKYGTWSASTSGAMNLSWYLAGHPYWKPAIHNLLPPVYNNSPSYWEDPWYANGHMVHFWDTWHLAGLQILRIGYNVCMFIYCLVQLSIFFPFVVLLAFKMVLSKKTKQAYSKGVFVTALSFLLLPSGLFVNHFESRFLWYMLPLGMLLTALAFQKMTNRKTLLITLFTLSILVFPLWCMKKLYNQGIEEYNTAILLKQQNIHGTFSGTPKVGLQSQCLQRIAYFSGNSYYSPVNPKVSKAEALIDIRRYHINYYFTYDTTGFVNEQGKNLPELKIGNLKIFKID